MSEGRGEIGEEHAGADVALVASNGERRADYVLTEQDLEQRLLAACKALRGPVDPTDYKAYIFPLLFLKRISDKWDWEHRRALEKFGGDEELALLEENYQFVLPDGCHWQDVLNLKQNVGSGLHKIMQRIEQANPKVLGGIFGDVQWGNKDKLPETALKGVLKEFSALNLDPEHAPGDVLGAAYEYLLKYFADESGKKAGEFFTPRSVVRLLTLILDPQEGESVHDPTCGSGGMLVEMVHVVREHEGDARTLKLSGQEVSLTTAAIARMNLFLHDIDDFRVRRGDTLGEPRFRTPEGPLEEFDIVLANPPFSHSPWGHEDWPDDPFGRSMFGTPPAQFGDYAFIEHMLTLMDNDEGRVGVVMSQSALFRPDPEATIRENIVEADLLEAIIGLPPDLFYNTQLPACLMIFRAPGHPRSGEVLFIDASKCFIREDARSVMPASEVARVAEVYRSGEGSDEDPRISARLVPVTDIKANGYVLKLGMNLPSVEETWDSVGVSLERFLEGAKAVEVSAETMAACLGQVGLDA
jgi:type I restriction enzyme M protein